VDVTVWANFHDPLHVVGAWKRYVVTRFPLRMRITLFLGIFTLNLMIALALWSFPGTESR
jgi:hypothetical protein